MPKTYSEKQREEVRQTLRKEANTCLIQYGVKKTTVDMLVERANIPKGTFYLFYPNKETLFFEVLLRLHNQVETEFLEELKKLNKTNDVDAYTRLFVTTLKKTMDTCLIRIFSDEGFHTLANKVPKEELAAHFQHDDDLMEQFLLYFPHKELADISVISGALRAIFLLASMKSEIGEKEFEPTIYMIVKGILLQIIKTRP